MTQVPDKDQKAPKEKDDHHDEANPMPEKVRQGYQEIIYATFFRPTQNNKGATSGSAFSISAKPLC